MINVQAIPPEIDPAVGHRGLAPDEVACRDCGQGVTRDQSREVTNQPVHEYNRLGLIRKTWSVEFGLCADCSQLENRARLIAKGHNIHRDRVLGVMVAHQILRRPMPEPDDEAWADMSTNLAPIGLGARWQSIVHYGTRERCARKPWRHAKSMRGDVRHGFANVMRDRIATDQPDDHLEPPTVAAHGLADYVSVTGGCLACGVGHVTRSAKWVSRQDSRDLARERVWEPRVLNLRGLGGRGKGQLAGFLCPDCAKAYLRRGAQGVSTVEYALTASMGVYHDPMEYEIPGVKGWGALVAAARRAGRPDPAANGEPWAHVDKRGIA